MSRPRSIRRAAAATFVLQWTGYIVQLLALVVLARLLIPEDYGLVTMVAALIGVAAVIGDFGLSLAAIREKHLSAAEASNLFWVNLGIGAAIAAVVAASSPAIAVFYGRTELTEITLTFSLLFLLNGAAVQFKVQINRQARFVQLGLVDLIGQVTGLAVAITAAVLGASYWALVLQQVSSAAMTLLVAIVLSQWHPGLPSRSGSIKKFLGFGRDTFALHIANYFTSNVDSVAIGQTMGSQVLGLYNRGFQVAVLPVNQVLAPLTRVFLPRLSNLNGMELSLAARNMQRVLTYFIVGPYVLLGVICIPLVPLVFGERWAGSGYVVAVLVPGAIFQTMGYLLYWVYLARGRTKELFVSEVGGRAVMVVLIIALAHLGALWVAAAVSIGQVLIWVVGTFVFARKVGLDGYSLTVITARPLLIFLIAGGAALAVYSFIRGTSAEANIVQAVVPAATWLLVVGLGLICIPPLRRELLGAIDYLRGRSSGHDIALTS